MALATLQWWSKTGARFTVTTLLRICGVFATPMSKLVQELDGERVYEELDSRNAKDM